MILLGVLALVAICVYIAGVGGIIISALSDMKGFFEAIEYKPEYNWHAVLVILGVGIFWPLVGIVFLVIWGGERRKE